MSLSYIYFIMGRTVRLKQTIIRIHWTTGRGFSILSNTNLNPKKFFCQEDGLILQQAHQNNKNVKEIILENWIPSTNQRPSKKPWKFLCSQNPLQFTKVLHQLLKKAIILCSTKRKLTIYN